MTIQLHHRAQFRPQPGPYTGQVYAPHPDTAPKMRWLGALLCLASAAVMGALIIEVIICLLP